MTPVPVPCIPVPRLAALPLAVPRRACSAWWAIVLFALLHTAAVAQSTAFVYQGRLKDATLAPAVGSHDLVFTLWDDPVDGQELGIVAHEGVELVDGLFTATLDFGVAAFAGDERYLEIAVKRSTDPGYTILAPRQPIHSSPYAVRTLQAGAADSAAVAADAGMLGGRPPAHYLLVDGSGAALTNLNASALSSGTLPDARLPPGVARTNGSQTFTGNQTVIGDLSVSGALEVATMVARVFQVGQAASTAWLIDAPSDYVSGNNQNPGLVLQRGLTYRFAVSTPGHPFRIATSNGGPAFNVGVVNNDLMSGTLTFKVPMDAPATLFYYCLAHPAMNGTITIQ